MKQQTFLKGAIILTIAGLINRILGFVLRVVMVHYLGTEGIGLYSMIYPIYITLILLCTFGFPVAIAKLVSERNAKKDVKGSLKLLNTALTFVLITSSIITCLLFITAKWISGHLFSNIRLYYLFLAIAPSLIFVSIASVLRSYFQGLRTMTPTAVSQFIEQTIRILASILLISLLIERGLQYGATGAAIGVTLGEFAGMLTLIILFIAHRYFGKSSELVPIAYSVAPSTSYTTHQAFKDLAKMGVPITIGRLVISLMYSIDAILIPNLLQKAGYSIAEATSQFGQLSGIALQIIFLPTIISVALTTSLVPSISDALARKNMKEIRKKYQEVLRFTFYIGFPATLFFVFKSSEICHLLFNYAAAGPILSILAVGAISTYYTHVAGGVLNGLGKPHLAVRNMVIGAFFKLGLLLTFVSHPMFGIKGAAISLTTGWIIGSIANFISIGKIVGFSFNLYHLVLKPLAGCWLLYWLLPLFNNLGISLGLETRWITLLTILVSAVIYIIWMIIVKGISKDDLAKFK